MRLFGLGGRSGEPETPEARQRREASELSLQRGGLPLDAIDRLRENASRQGKPGHIFTGDLSVNELVLAHDAGYSALGQVMGSSVYHVGWQYMPTGYYSNWGGGGSSELQILTQAFYDARHLAIGRLQQEAAILGATGVIGVRISHRAYDWGVGLLEFQAIGTAIRETGAPPSANGKPFVSDLSGQEFWMLRQSGFQPVGLAVGNCSYYCVPSWNTRWATGGAWSGGWTNQELTDYTQAVYTARSLAMSRMEHEALTEGATGVVGADVEVEVEPREVEISENNKRLDMMYHFTAIGTAIAPYKGRWPIFSVMPTVALE